MKSKLKLLARDALYGAKALGKQKIFCVGCNKTGTTSLLAAMLELGYTVGHQRRAEAQIHNWAKRRFSPLVRQCRTAQFFQDIPFSKPYTYIALDQAFPNSKFILTIRDSEEQWYNSVTKFHTKLWSSNNEPPTKEELMKATYHYEGWAWEMNRYSYNSPEDNPYEKEALVDYYNSHNKAVINYFKHRPQDLLILNVSKPDAYKKLCMFIGKTPVREQFSWKNKT